MKLLPNHSKLAIKTKANVLKIKSNNYDRWTEEENLIFKEAWETYTMDELLKAFPNRTYQKMMLHAKNMGYKSIIDRHRKNDLSFLDIENLTPSSCYWWGFIMADGHLSKRGLIVQLKDVDTSHLQKLSTLLKCNMVVKDGFCRICPEDVKRIRKWEETFEMKETAKTYFPPVLKMFEDLFIYFFIGFVDGDGCIWLSRNYPQLKIELHSSWFENLVWFSNCLKRYGINSTVKVSNKNTSVLTIGNRNDILKLLDYCKEVDFLERKWDKLFEYKKNN